MLTDISTAKDRNMSTLASIGSSFCHSIRGVQRGEAPLRFLIVPQEWGIKGVESETVLVGFASLNPPYIWEWMTSRIC